MSFVAYFSETMTKLMTRVPVIVAVGDKVKADCEKGEEIENLAQLNSEHLLAPLARKNRMI